GEPGQVRQAGLGRFNDGGNVMEWIFCDEWGVLAPGPYLIHDRDGKFCPAFEHTVDRAGVMRMVLPPRLPNLNAYAERWVRSVKEEVLSRLMLFGESTLRRVLNEYVGHYHHDRNHQGTGNVRLFPSSRSQASEKPVFRVHYNAVDRHSVLRY